MWKNVENKKSLSLHNSQLSRDWPMLHLVSKKDIVGNRKSKSWFFMKYRETFAIPFM